MLKKKYQNVFYLLVNSRISKNNVSSRCKLPPLKQSISADNETEKIYTIKEKVRFIEKYFKILIFIS